MKTYNDFIPIGPEYLLVTKEEMESLKIERDKYKQAIIDCLAWSNGREYEWGERAINAFQFLEKALENKENE